MAGRAVVDARLDRGTTYYALPYEIAITLPRRRTAVRARGRPGGGNGHAGNVLFTPRSQEVRDEHSFQVGHAAAVVVASASAAQPSAGYAAAEAAAAISAAATVVQMVVVQVMVLLLWLHVVVLHEGGARVTGGRGIRRRLSRDQRVD